MSKAFSFTEASLDVSEQFDDGATNLAVVSAAVVVERLSHSMAYMVDGLLSCHDRNIEIVFLKAVELE